MAEVRRRRTRQLVATEAEEAAAAEEQSHPDLVVLVVDDEPDVRETLRLSLSLEGWTVLEASSAEEALEIWNEAAPSVVLLDQNLPGMTGLECAAELRAKSTDARIIMFSGFLDPEASKEARRLRLLPLSKTDRTRLFELLALLADQVKSTPSHVC
jgi:CheY-like chemotaxis protein